MYRFHISLHARPSDLSLGPIVELDGQRYQTLASGPHLLAEPMMASFEQASLQLAALPRMFLEPDGSMVWRSNSTASAWQVDGVLYDRDDRLIYVDLKGCCPAEQFDQLLGALGWPGQSFIFQLAREALLLDEGEFRRFAEQADSA